MKRQTLWRGFALLLAVVLLLSGLPAATAAEDDGLVTYPVEGGAIYLNRNTVVDADETVTKVEIPATNEDTEVVAIGHDAFAGCSGLETVIFPDTICLITYGSFTGCSSLKSLYFEGNAPTIEDENEFQDASDDLTLYYIDGTTGWDQAPWNEYPCEVREKTPDPLYTPYPVEGGNIYVNTTTGFVVGRDSTVTKVEIPEQVGGASVTGIAAEVFRHCYDLTCITVPATVTQIELPNFSQCEHLTEIQVASGNPSYSSINGILYNADQTELVCIPGGVNEAYQFPDTVTHVHPEALHSSRITSITIPARMSDTDIPVSALRYNSCLEQFEVEDGNPSYQSIGGFLCNLEGTLLSIPGGLRKVVEVPEGIRTLGSNSFFGLNITGMRIPASVTKIEADVIPACDILWGIYFMGDAPVSIAQDAFKGGSRQLTVFFREGTKGWSVPTWQGYASTVWADYPAYSWCSPFVDIRPGQWYFNDVAFVTEHRLMNGMGPGKFSPNVAMSRGMMVTVLYRLAGEPQVSTAEKPFSDVYTGSYFEKAVIWASQNQLVLGRGNGRFDPDGTISRQDMVTIFYRYAKFMGYSTDVTSDLKAFTDGAKVSGYAVDAMRWAVGIGLINGMKNGNVSTLAPTASSTRAQVAAVFHRFVEKTAS